MRDQLLQVDDAPLQQPDCPRPGVGISVLELQVHLTGTEPHERDLDLVPPDTDNEHLAAELARLDRARNTALHTGALHGDGRLVALAQTDDLLSKTLCRQAALDQHRLDARAELLCKVQSSLVDIRNDNGVCAGGLDAGQSDETDGAGTAHQHGVAEGDVCALHAGQRDGEGLEHGAVFERHVADLVAPYGGVVDVAAEETGDRGRAAEQDGLAPVVAACQAGLAGVADDVGLDGYAVAGLEVRYGGVGGDDGAGGLVAEDVVVGDDHGANAAGVPEVDIRAGRGVSLLTLRARRDVGQ